MQHGPVDITKINYHYTKKELIQVMYEYLKSKLVIQILIKSFIILTIFIMLCRAYIAYVTKQNVISNIIIIFCFAVTLICYNHVIKKIIYLLLRNKQEIHSFEVELHNNYLIFKTTNKQPNTSIKVLFNTLRTSILTKNNLIIPLTGFINIGKFIFIPHNILKDQNLTYILAKKIKIKSI